MPARKPRAKSRSGALVVEMAFVLPVLILLVLGLIQYGHACMVGNLLQDACRTAARYGSTGGVSTAQVSAKVLEVMGAAINAQEVTVIVKNASVYDTAGPYPSTTDQYNALPNIELTSASSRQLFLVRATVQYRRVGVSGITLVPFTDNLVLARQVITRHE